MSAPRLQRFVTATARLGLVPVSVRRVVDILALFQVSFRVLRPFPIIIILPLLHTHLYLNIALTRRTSGLSLGNSDVREQSTGNGCDVGGGESSSCNSDGNSNDSGSNSNDPAGGDGCGGDSSSNNDSN